MFTITGTSLPLWMLRVKSELSNTLISMLPANVITVTLSHSVLAASYADDVGIDSIDAINISVKATIDLHFMTVHVFVL